MVLVIDNGPPETVRKAMQWLVGGDRTAGKRNDATPSGAGADATSGSPSPAAASSQGGNTASAAAPAASAASAGAGAAAAGAAAASSSSPPPVPAKDAAAVGGAVGSAVSSLAGGVADALRSRLEALRLSGGSVDARKAAVALVGLLGLVGLSLAAVRRLQAAARAARLARELGDCMRDTTACHLFITRRCRLAPARDAACVEAEAFLRAGRIAYVAHYVESASDVLSALQRLPPGARPPLVTAPTSSAGKAATAARIAASVTTSVAPTPRARAGSTGGGGSTRGPSAAPTPRRRSGAPQAVQSQQQQQQLQLVPAYPVSQCAGELPIMIYADRGVFVGAAAATAAAAELFLCRLDEAAEDDPQGSRSHTGTETSSLAEIKRRCAQVLLPAVSGVVRAHPSVHKHFTAAGYHLHEPPAAAGDAEYNLQAELEALAARLESAAATAGSTVTAAGGYNGSNGSLLFGTAAPTSADCAVFAALLPLTLTPVEELVTAGSPALLYLSQSPPLHAFVRRVMRACYADLGVLTLRPPAPAGEATRYDFTTVTDMRGAEEEVLQPRRKAADGMLLLTY